MIKFCILSCFISVAVLAGDLEDFLAYCRENGKIYDDIVEETKRLNNFLQNRQMIANHNGGRSTFKMTTNRFTDLTYGEFLTFYTGLVLQRRDSSNFVRFFREFFNMLQSTRAIFSSSFDWRTKMAVSRVKDQGKCGSCWAFAATGALESHIYIKTKRSLLLSEQNLVDCTLNNTKNFGIYRSYGCGGGMTSRAFNYIRDNKGINTEHSYPYQAANLECRHNVTNDDAKNNQGYLGIFPDETLIKLIVTNIGPVAVALHVSEKFIHYQSGVYNEPNCPRTINHAVLIVGYGTENGQDYWIVKNSWGTTWGEDGYFRILRGVNHCGIALYATYPLV